MANATRWHMWPFIEFDEKLYNIIASERARERAGYRMYRHAMRQQNKICWFFVVVTIEMTTRKKRTCIASRLHFIATEGRYIGKYITYHRSCSPFHSFSFSVFHSSQFTYKILCDVQMHTKPFTILMEIGYFSAQWDRIASTARPAYIVDAYRTRCSLLL